MQLKLVTHTASTGSLRRIGRSETNDRVWTNCPVITSLEFIYRCSVFGRCQCCIVCCDHGCDTRGLIGSWLERLSETNVDYNLSSCCSHFHKQHDNQCRVLVIGRVYRPLIFCDHAALALLGDNLFMTAGHDAPPI